jgi:Ca2+-binding EF-hand superfamily protein
MDYMRMMAEVKDSPDNMDMVRESFSQFDKAGTGILSSGELSFILQRVGDTLNAQEMENFIKLIDNGNGQIRMNDLMKIFEMQIVGDMMTKQMALETNALHNM